LNEKAGAWLDTGVINKDGTPSGASTSYCTEAANGCHLFLQRLAIVRVPRAMTLAEFNQAYPSAIPMEELALINHLEGPQAVMPAGFRAKRIVGK
jgi:hypothetical protein